MIDYHCHLLPGVDDGAGSLEEALQMAHALHEAGYREVYCTPHRIRGGYDLPSAEIRERVAALQAELERCEIPVRLHAGREHYLDEFLLDIIAEDPLTLGESNLLLVELPNMAQKDLVQRVCHRLTCDGYRVVIAHPERSRLFSLPGCTGRQESRVLRWLRTRLGKLRDPEPVPCTGREPLRQNDLLGYLLDLGCLFQANLGSFCGAYGTRARHNSISFWEHGLYSMLGTDLHSLSQAEMLTNSSFPARMQTPLQLNVVS